VIANEINAVIIFLRNINIGSPFPFSATRNSLTHAAAQILL
jgi:hypothetical protein